MTTWTTLRSKIAAKANDPTLQRNDAATYLSVANDALVSLAANHTPWRGTVDLVPDSETTLFDLPADMIEYDQVYGVKWDTKWLNTTDTFAGGEHTKELTYYIWPTGQIQFSAAPVTGKTLTLYYSAYYPDLAADDDLVPAPTWSHEAIALYAAARLLETQAAKMALLGNFKQRTESGTPEDNPLLEVSKYYMKQYWSILGQRPAPRTIGL
jgi:hypothetical protein